MQAKLGLALGAGGIQGAAHIGVLRALEEAGLEPVAFAGASAGSLAAAMAASNWTPERMLGTVRNLDPGRVYQVGIGPGNVLGWAGRWLLGRLNIPGDWLPQPPRGLLSRKALEATYKNWFGSITVCDVPRPLAVVATDLTVSEPVIFHNQPASDLLERLPRAARERTSCYEGTDVPLAKALAASTSIPGLFEPVEWNGHILVDGGVLDYVPADVVRAMGASCVIAVDVSQELQHKQRAINNIVDVLWSSFEAEQQTITDATLAAAANLVLEPSLPPASLWDIAKIPAIASAGYDYARAHLKEIRAQLSA